MAIDSALQVDLILDSALRAFKKKILPLRLFALAFRKDPVPLQRGENMKVPYYPLHGTASKDFNGTYDFTGAGPNVDFREIPVNKRKYQPIVTTSAQIARFNYSPDEVGRIRGEKLAGDVVADILSLVTAANFGASVFVGAASTFDADDVADIQLACDVSEWPAEMRALILKAAYNTSLLKDNSIQNAAAYGSADPIQEGVVARINGFQVAPTNELPANGENLIGMAAYQSALLVGFSPIPPDPSVRSQLVDYRVVQDPDTEIFIEYRAWGDPDSDSRKEVIECNYGKAVGEAAALKRLVSA